MAFQQIYHLLLGFLKMEWDKKSIVVYIKQIEKTLLGWFAMMSYFIEKQHWDQLQSLLRWMCLINNATQIGHQFPKILNLIMENDGKYVTLSSLGMHQMYIATIATTIYVVSSHSIRKSSLASKEVIKRCLVGQNREVNGWFDKA